MIKIGQIGMEHDHAEGKMSCVRKFPDVFELVGIAEENQEILAARGSRDSYKGVKLMSIDELLNVPGLDAIMVETDELSLVKFAQICIDKGIHVHVDKPAGANVGDFKKLLTSAKSKNLIVQLAYMYRYNPAVQYCLDAVRSGQLGNIYQVDAIMNSWYPPEKREWTNKFPGGNMFFLGCHMVDLVMLMAGVPERIVPFNKSSGIDGITAIDHGFAVFEYKNGISTVRATLTECNGYNRRQLVVCGDNGTIEIKPLELQEGGLPSSMLSMTTERGWGGSYKEISLPKATGRYDAMMLEFARLVEDGMQNPFNYEYELLVQKAVLAACGVKEKI